MDEIEIARVLATLAEQFVVKPGRAPNLPTRIPAPEDAENPYAYFGIRGGLVGLYFRVNMLADNHGYEKDGNTYHEEWERSYRRTVHVIVTEKHNVFTAVTGCAHPDIPAPELWKNTSNHDSCWSSDGLHVFREVSYEAYEACWSHVPQRHRPAPKDLSIFNTFDYLFNRGSAFSYVRVVGAPAENYRFSITEVKELDYEVVLKEIED